MKSRRSKRKNPEFKVIKASSTPGEQQRQQEKLQTRVYQLETLASGRRGQERSNRAAPLTQDSSVEPDVDASLMDVDGAPSRAEASDVDTEGLEGTTTVCVEEKKGKKRDNKTRILAWLPSRSLYLDELLRHDGLGGHHSESKCDSCSTNSEAVAGCFRCLDCHRSRLLCHGCLLREHASLPLHRVEEWTAGYFRKTSLHVLGLKIQLGHLGQPCPNPGYRRHRLVVCDLSGFHEVDTTFCECYNPQIGLVHRWQQLFRLGWYPATNDRPSTVFTFALLDFFHELTHQGKANLYDFHKTLDRITDNSGTVAGWNRYRQLSDAIRQWRNLHLLKRSGRGHDPTGIEATQEGACAVECAACPHPGRNLPTGWENAPADIAWMYMLVLSLDANFKLKLKDREFDNIDLTRGWSYFVEDVKYKDFMRRYGDQDEDSTCSVELKAIRKANVSREGYLASGVGACLCARHSLIRKNGVADLQKGEKYCSMDYVLLATLIGMLLMLMVTYDLACQYHKNFLKRMAEFPPCMQLPSDISRSTRWAIPKKHWGVHGPNHSRWSLNYLKESARTSGEGIETGWSHMNPVSVSTREMAPAVRREVLDDHWGSWNWQKTVNFGSHFASAIKLAYLMKNKQQKIADDYTSSFPAETTRVWQDDINRWDADHSSKPDPYEDIFTSITMNEVTLRLKEEDAADRAAGLIPSHHLLPGAFLEVGLAIEEQQRNLARRVKGRKSVSELANLQQQRNALAHRIEGWRPTQEMYMPMVSSLLAGAASVTAETGSEDEDSPAPIKAEDVKLYLPSSLPDHLRIGAFYSSLALKEARLRVAQAEDALAEIRRLRRILMGVVQFRELNVAGTGQTANTRMRHLYDKYQGKIVAATARYRTAFTCLGTLDPNGSWSLRLRELKKEDIRGPGRETDEPLLGEGRRDVSWIWLVPGSNTTADTTQEFNNSARVEWCKTQARMKRWIEEYKILQEEMRRVLAFFEWKAEWWLDQRFRRADLSPDMASGVSAYAEKQAAMYRQLASTFAKHWLPLLTTQGVVPVWAAQYPIPVDKGKGHAIDDVEQVEEDLDGQEEEETVDNIDDDLWDN